MTLRFRARAQARGLILAAVIVGGSGGIGYAASRDIEVLIDQATMLRLEQSAAEIVIGNPSIADVSVQSDDTLVLTGKSFGETNLIVIGKKGSVLINRRVVVQEPEQGYVTLFRGAKRETLHCAPNCESPLVIGDSPAHFEPLSKEIRTKQAIAQDSADGQGSGE